MNVIYNAPVTIDNSKERESLLGLCRSFYWRLSRDYRGIKRSFSVVDEGYEFRTASTDYFMLVICILDLACVSFTYYRFNSDYVILVKEF